MNRLDRSQIQALAIGGTILGGGGGGRTAKGVEMAGQAYAQDRNPSLISLSELNDDDLVLTISAVGAPSARQQHIDDTDYARIMDIFMQNFDRPIKALIANEMGGLSSFNPFVPSALHGIPVIDGACNGRAHPLGIMGAMRLAEQAGYQSLQAASGGSASLNRHVEIWAAGTIETASSLVQHAAIGAGGLVAVARNPVSKNYLIKHAAIGCLSQSHDLGESYLSGTGAGGRIANVVNCLHGDIVCTGTVTHLFMEIADGLDRGVCEISDGKAIYKLYIWNEYMALARNGERLSTFPDLIMTFNKQSGEPVISADLVAGQELVLIHTSHSNLMLGSGMSELSGYRAIEKVLGIEVIPYAEALIC